MKCPHKFLPALPALAAILFICTSATATSKLAESEYEALYDLYNATNGESWTWQNSAPVWNFLDGSDPCIDQWQGITCANTTAPNHVTELFLRGYNLTGPLPASIGNFPQLHELYLYYNHLTGEIPPSISNLPQLQLLHLGTNAFTGAFPAWITTLSKLQYLDLGGNILTSSIPASISDLRELVYLNLYVNLMTGLLPESIGDLTLLQTLELGSLVADAGYYSPMNRFEGPLPASMGKLTALTILNLDYNLFSGHIPDFFGNFSSMKSLEVAHNGWSGPIPSFIAGFTELEYIDLGQNALTGGIPDALFLLPKMGQLYLWDNALNGTVPNVPNALPKLTYLYLQDNQFTGTIPLHFINGSALVQLYVDNNHLHGDIDFIEGLPELQLLSVAGNKFTGTIPEIIGGLTFMFALYLQDNKFKGSIPEELYSLSALWLLDLADNKLTGTISPRIGNLVLQTMNMSSNQLRGSIPATLNVQSLIMIALSDNELTGTIPYVFSTANMQVLDLHNNQLKGRVPPLLSTALRVVFLEGNQLTGPLTEVFKKAHNNLNAVRLDGNQFTGELPSVLFQPQLKSLSIVGSCLHGSLPDNICDAAQLEALILYGLTTGDSCRATGVKALTSTDNFGGAFPRCLLELPSMNTLLLSSNRLTGSFGDDVVISEKLRQLDLSHNRLSGSIPRSIQNHTWSLLDLSHNKLKGKLDEGLFASTTIAAVDAESSAVPSTATPYTPPPELALTTNRLSGDLPASVMSLVNVSILAGNLYRCNYDKSDLPEHDTALDTYECASNSFNVAMYIWLGLVVLVPTVIVGWYYYVGQRVQWTFPLVQLPDALAGRLTDMYSVLESYHVIYKSSWCCALLALCVLLPYYVVVSHFEGTHTQQYAYVLSCIYTSGVIPFTLNVVFWAAALAALYYSTFLRHLKCRVTHSMQATWEMWRSRAQVMLVYTFTSVAVVLGANVAFVYGILYGDSTYQIAYQVALSLFKLAWSNVLSPIMIRRLDLFFSASEDNKPRHFFALQLLVSMFNNIAIPCLVVMAIDPNCFSSILVPPTAKEVDYLLPTCISGGIIFSCDELSYQETSLKFTPPFNYSFQCSASFVTSYAATFIYSSLACIILNPLLKRTLCLLHSRTAPGTFLHKAISVVLPRIFHPLEEPPPTAKSLRLRPIAGAVGVLVNLLTQWGTLLTFGVVFPPIALAMAVSITVGVYDTRTELQNFLRRVTEEGKLGYLDLVNAECAGVGTAEHVLLAVKLIVCYCCAFYTLFLFDALGDTQGFRASWWVLVVFPLLPFAVLGSVRVYRDYVMGSDTAVEAKEGVDLREGLLSSGDERLSVFSALHGNVDGSN